MSLRTDLARALPARDVNGDTITLIDRADVFRILWGIIKPIKRQFQSIQEIRRVDPALGLSYDERIRRGDARLLFDLNTDVGKKAFLDVWWPWDADGACVCWTGAHGQEPSLPYPTRTMVRSAGVTLRLGPDLVLSSIRFGVLVPTTTRVRALWDIGIRRQLWHLTLPFHEYLKAEGAVARLYPLEAGDPLRHWNYMPGTPTPNQPRSFYLDMENRPRTDDLLAWLKGTP